MIKAEQMEVQVSFDVSPYPLPLSSCPTPFQSAFLSQTFRHMSNFTP